MLHPKRYDAVVVGAGPAGATAAYFLGRGGAQVLVVDAARLPREKPCGGAVPRSVCRQFPFPFDTVVESRPTRVTYCWNAGMAVDCALPGEPMAMVERDSFDWHILQHAGVEVRDGTLVQGFYREPAGVCVQTEHQGTIFADYVIAADGAISHIARLAGLRRRPVLRPALEARVRPDPDTFSRFADGVIIDFGAIAGGYLWVFAKREHLSVGLVALFGKAAGLQAALQAALDRLGISLAGATVRGHPLPLYVRPETVHSGHVLLAGDAAGLVDPFSGEGIRHAVASGRQAAEAILAGQEERYTATVRRYAAKVLRPAGLVARLFYPHAWDCYRYGVRNPRASRLLSAWVNGDVSRARLMNGLALSLIESIVKRQ